MVGAAIDDIVGEATPSSPEEPAALEVPTDTQAAVTFPPTWTIAPVTPTITVEQITPTRFTFASLTTVPTITFVLPTPMRADYGPLLDVCDCGGDIYNCDDFPNQVAAQYCLRYCRDQGKGDIHNLDGDGDGRACEG